MSTRARKFGLPSQSLPSFFNHFDGASDNSGFTLNREGKGDSWTYLKNRVQEQDGQFVGNLRDELDSDLIFAGLFSAVVTAFLMESYNFLQPNQNEPIVDVLQSILHELQTNSNSTTNPNSPVEIETAWPDPRIYNILWFTALATSLFVALFSILIKQWLREYCRWSEAHGQDAIRIQEMRHQELLDWGVKFNVIVILPFMLQASVILFVVGLVFFLLQVDRSVAIVVSIVLIFYLTGFLYTLLLPCFSDEAPFRTPVAIHVRNFVNYIGSFFEVVGHMVRFNLSWSQARSGIALSSRFDWVERDIRRSRVQIVDLGYDRLNTAFAWLRSQFPDDTTRFRILDCISEFQSLPFVLDAGRRLKQGPQQLSDVLQYWTRPPKDGEAFEPTLLIDGLEAVYLTPRAPGDFPSLVPPVEVLPGLTEFIIYSHEYRVSEDHVTRLTRLFWDLHSYQHDHLGLGSSLPKENDLAYRRILRFLLEPRPSWIKPPEAALERLLGYGTHLHRRLTVDGSYLPVPPRSLPTAALVFQIVVLSMDEYLEHEKLRAFFNRLCMTVSQFFVTYEGVPEQWESNIRHEFWRPFLQFHRNYRLVFRQLDPLIDLLRKSDVLPCESSETNSPV